MWNSPFNTPRPSGKLSLKRPGNSRIMRETERPAMRRLSTTKEGNIMLEYPEIAVISRQLQKETAGKMVTAVLPP